MSEPDPTLLPVVLFDAGNTLVELDYDALAGILSRHTSVIDGETVGDAIVRTRPDVDRFLRRRTASTESPDVREFILSLTYDRLRIPATTRRAITADVLEVLQSLWTRPTEGAGSTLRALRKRGHRLGVVSNSDGSIAAYMRKLGFAEHLDVIVDSHLVGVEKPDPEIFEIALRALGAAPDQALYVGDLPAVDILGAERAGLRPVLVDPLDLFPSVSCRRIRALPELLTNG